MGLSNYAFIDSQNLNLGVRSEGWKIDYRKLRLYLKNKYNVSTAFLSTGLVKGNVDAEPVLHAGVIQFNNYEKALVISGYGDFACLYEFLEDQGKLLRVLNPNSRYSQLLKPFAKYIVEVDTLKTSLGYQKSQHRRSVETLGLSGNGDIKNIAKSTTNVNPRQGGK